MITHSFSQASLFDVILMKLMISTAYIYISWNPCPNEHWVLFFSSRNEIKKQSQHARVAGTKPATPGDSLWHMLTRRREASTKERTAKQKEVQPVVGGMGSLTLERDESWGVLTVEFIPGLSFLQMHTALLLSFFSMQLTRNTLQFFLLFVIKIQKS